MLRRAPARRPGRGSVDGAGVGGTGGGTAGVSSTTASILRIRMPSTRPTTDASTSVPSDSRPVRLPAAAGPACTVTGALALAVRLQTLRRPVRELDDLRIALMSGPGTDDVADGEDCELRDRHESSFVPWLRRRSDEIPALPAVSPATLPATISPVLRALPEPSPLTLGALSEPVTVSTSRCLVLLLLPGLTDPRWLSAGLTSLATCSE